MAQLSKLLGGATYYYNVISKFFDPLIDAELMKSDVRGECSIDIFLASFISSFLSVVDINGRTSPVLSTGLYALEQRYRDRIHTRAMCVAGMYMISCLYSTFSLFPGQCNK